MRTFNNFRQKVAYTVAVFSMFAMLFSPVAVGRDLSGLGFTPSGCDNATECSA